METLTKAESIAFARYAKNFTSPNDVEEAYNHFLLLTKHSKKGIICQTGDQFARVLDNGKCYSVYQMCWCYRPSERKGVDGKYFPSAYNLMTHYMRTPQKTATPYNTPIEDWTVHMFLQALRYLPKEDEDVEWKANLHRIISWESHNKPVWEKFPISITLFRT